MKWSARLIQWPADHWKTVCLLLFVAAWCLRATAATSLSRGFSPGDDSEYIQRAWHLRHGQGMIARPAPADGFTPETSFHPTFETRPTFRRPLTILLVAGLQALFGEQQLLAQRLVLALLGACAVVCVAHTGKLWWGCWPGLLAGIAYLTYPYNIRHDVEIYDNITTNFCVTLFVLLCAVWQRSPRLSIVASMGLIAGLFSLNRYDGQALIVLGAVFVGWRLASQRRRWLLHTAVFIVSAGACLLPWVAYVHAISGHWSTGSGSGFGLWEVYNDGVYGIYPNGTIDDGISAYWRQLDWGRRRELLLAADEFAMDARMKEMAFEWMRSHPAAVVRMLPEKLWAAFGPVLSPVRPGIIQNAMYSLWYAPVLCGAIVSMWRHRRAWGLWLPAVLPLIGFIAVTLVSFAHTRHRVAYDGPLFVLAAGALVASVSARTGIAEAPATGQ